MDYQKTLEELLADPTIASKNWIYRQYDHQVRDGTCVLPGSDAAVFRLLLDELTDEPPRAEPVVKHLAITTDCNALHSFISPRQGAQMAVAEACRNIICSGGKPLAVSDNLNFGNPLKPESFWYLRECVEGMAEACRAFETPVTGGNVSLYNESPEGAIDPTAVVCMVGLIEEARLITTQWFKNEGDLVYLVGPLGTGLGGSQYLAQQTGRKMGPLPCFDFQIERNVQSAISTAIRMGILASAHDCSEGGLAVALAECCISGEKKIGAQIALPETTHRIDDLLFNEAPSRVVVSISPKEQRFLQEACRNSQVPLYELGTVGGAGFEIKAGGKSLLSAPVDQLHETWYHAIARAVEK
jgi:phosphoribosylformylglycinamidine synthase